MIRAAALLLLCSLGSGLCAQDFAEVYQRAEALRLRGGVDVALIRQGYREALAAFDRLPADATARLQALPAAAFCAEQAAEPARAVELIEAAMTSGVVDAFHVELHVRALARAGRAADAVRAIAHGSRQHADAVVLALRQVYGECAGALCEAAEIALREGRDEVGLRTFAALCEAAGRHPTALANWALALHHIGRDDEAEARYREALAAAPDDSDLWNDLGLLLKGQRRDGEAMAAFRRSHELDPTPTKLGPASTNLALMHRLGRAGDPPVDVVATLRGGLGRSPVSAMARRLILDELRDRRAFPGGRPDTRAPRR